MGDFPMAYSKGSLVLSKATAADIPVLSTTFHRAFHDNPFFMAMLPDTPANDRWWQESHKIALLDPKSHVVKVVDQENGEIVAMARWVLPGDDGSPQPGSADDRWPDFTDDIDRTLADPLFASMARSRKEFMGDRKHYRKLADIFLPAEVVLLFKDMLLTKSSLRAVASGGRVQRPWRWFSTHKIWLRPG